MMFESYMAERLRHRWGGGVCAYIVSPVLF